MLSIENVDHFVGATALCRRKNAPLQVTIITPTERRRSTKRALSTLLRAALNSDADFSGPSPARCAAHIYRW
jgi:hypothetical protein